MAKSAASLVEGPDDDLDAGELSSEDSETQDVDFDEVDEDTVDDDDELSDEFDGQQVDFDDEDDTEEDLDAILKARLGTNDEDDEGDEDDDPVKASTPPTYTVVEEGDGFTVRPRQASEWICAACFLIVNKVAAAAAACPHCGADASETRPELASQ
jgi:hypothetical protein